MALTKIPAHLSSTPSISDSGTATAITIDSSGHVTLAGNLAVTGSTTTADNLVSADKNITLNYHASNDTSGSADGAGITIQDAVNSSTDATLLWDASDDRFKFSHGVEVTSGNVGIGTASPTAKFEVHDDSGGFDSSSVANAVASSVMHIQGNNDMRIIFTEDGSSYRGMLGYEHAGSTYMGIWDSGSSATPSLVSQGGKIGIGTTSPNGLLHIGDSSAEGSQSAPALQIGSTTNYRLGMYTTNEGAFIENKNGDDGINFLVKTSGQSMRIDGGTGYVGIGDTDPFSKLHVEDTSWSSGAPYGCVLSVTGNNVNDNNWGHLIVTDSSTGNGHGGSIRFGTGTADSSNLNPFAGIQGVAEGTSHGGLALYTRPSGGTATERMAIASNGRVGIGTSTTAYSTSLLTVRNNANSSIQGVSIVLEPTSNTSDIDGALTIEMTDANITGGTAMRINTAGSQSDIYAIRTRYNGTSSEGFAVTGEGKVGIGDINPDTKLHVAGNVKVGTAASSSWSTSSHGDGGLDVFVGSGTDGLTVWDDNSQSAPRFTVKRAGFVGIGGATGAWIDSSDVMGVNGRVYVRGYGHSAMALGRLNSGGSAGEDGAVLDILHGGYGKGRLGVNATNIFQVQATNSARQLQLCTHDGNESIELNPGGNITFELGGTERMKLDDSDASTPLMKLADTHPWIDLVAPDGAYWKGGLTVRGGASSTQAQLHIHMTRDSSMRKLSSAGNYDAYISTTTANAAAYGDLIFGVDDTEVFRLDSASKYIGIGTETPTANVHIVATGTAQNSSDSKFYLTKNSGNDWSMVMAHGADDYGYNVHGNGGYAYAVYNQPNSSYRGRWNFNGELYTSDGNVHDIDSDISLKEEITDAPSQWQMLKDLKLQRFKWKDKRLGDVYSYGWIAQTVETDYPEFVGLQAQTQEQKKAGETPTLKTVQSGAIQKRAIAALQEAMERIETLEAEVAALKG